MFGVRNLLSNTESIAIATARKFTIANATPVKSFTIAKSVGRSNSFTRSSIPVFSIHKRQFGSSVVRMGVHNIANKAEFTAALKEHKIVVVDAFATWCGPCKVVAPHVVKFSEEFPDVHFTKIDVDDVPDVAQELGIRVMPTFLIFKGEEKIAEVVGANPKGLQAAIQKVVDAEKA